MNNIIISFILTIVGMLFMLGNFMFTDKNNKPASTFCFGISMLLFGVASGLIFGSI